MSMADRRAETEWAGTLTEGSGTLELVSSGAASLPVTWASRVESPDGRTSPEELVAAAHSSCYAMAFSNSLTTDGTPPERLHVTAVVSLNPKEGGGVEVTDSALTVTGVVSLVTPTYPVAVYSHQDGDAMSSGFIYRGTRMPSMITLKW